MIDSSKSSPRIEQILFWVPFLSFAFFYQGADQSTAARFDLMRSILERGALQIDGYCGFNTADIISFAGHYYSVKAPGASFTGIIQWALFTALLSPLRFAHEALYWALASWLTIVFSTSLLVALSSVVMYRLVLKLGAGQSRAIICALLLPFATITFPYATEMTGEPLAGVTALTSFYLLVSHRPEDDAGRMMFAGTLAGWAVLCDFPTLLIAAGLGFFALARLGWSRHLLGFAIGAAAVAAVLLAYNAAAFGRPFFLSYEAYKMSGNTQFPEQAIGFVGLTYPRPSILWKILFDPQRGLFFCNPVLLLAIPGIIYMTLRRELRAAAAVISFAAVSMILFNASFGESIISWGGGTATGPRQIVAAIPFMVIPLAFLPARWNWSVLLLGLVSGAAMLAATAVEPHFPYEYSNPLRDFIAPAYLRGDFAYDRDAYFGGRAITRESTAFNLGELAHLPGPIQLWPLAALCGVAAWLLTRGALRRFTIALYVGLSIIFLLPLTGLLRKQLARPAPHGLRGQYFRGLRPDGCPPHIVRVDRQLVFHDVAELGALPAPSRALWTGTLLAPTTGQYFFEIEADDLGWLTIDGVPVIRDLGDSTQGLRQGKVTLAAGPHHIEVGERNLQGDAAMLLAWRPPGQSLQIIPPSAFTPN